MRPERLYGAYVFDMDGTIYLGDDVLPGVRDTLAFLGERGIPLRFLSNNPTKDPEQYAAKLARLGLPTPVDDSPTPSSPPCDGCVPTTPTPWCSPSRRSPSSGPCGRRASA